MGRSVREQRRHLAQNLRGEGHTWPEIAAAIRGQWPELTALQAMRHAHQLTQAQVLDRWMELHPDTRRPEDRELGRWENWPDPGGIGPSWGNLDRLARIYECAAADLIVGVSDYRHHDRPTRNDGTEGTGQNGDSDMQRREMLRLAATAAAAGPALVQGLDTRPRVGAAEVARIEEGLRSMFAVDDHSGGGAVQLNAVQACNAIGEMLDHASYSEVTGRRLRSLAGRTAEMAGWAAYDAGRPDEARRWYGHALMCADINDDFRLRALVLTSTSVLALESGQPREALDLSHAVQHTARPFASSRLASLLASREASAWSRLGAMDRCVAALAASEAALDEGELVDPDDEWLAFWGPSQLMGVTARCNLEAGQLADAETSARQALALNPAGYRRNEALHLTRLAEALITRDEVEEGASVMVDVNSRLGDVASSRVTKRLAALRTVVADRAGADAAEELFAT